MSAAATPAVVKAARARPDGPALIYDLGVVAGRMKAARTAAQAAGVELLYAVKAFPVPAAIALACEHLDGLDVAGPDEQALLLGADRPDGPSSLAAGRAAASACDVPPTSVSVTWPGDVDRARLAMIAARHRVTVVCETAAQLAAAAEVRGATLAIRLRSDEASRFGVPAEELRELAAAVPGRVRALHVHGGPLVTAPARVGERARAVWAVAAAAGIELAQLDLGGSLHGFVIDRPTSGQSTVADAFAAARAAVPAGVRVIFEPGRLWSEGAGFAAGRVLATRMVGERMACVLELSRLAHLRWCTPRLVAPPPRAGAPRLGVELWGASCCEDDRIDDAWVPVEHAGALAVGEQVVLAGVTGYAAAWNRGFAGVPAARVITVGT